MQHCRCNFLISLIIFVHFVIYSSLTFLCNFAYEIKSSIVFFKVLNNFIVYLLISFFFKLINIDSNNRFFNILSNFFKFITFQFCLKQR